MTERIVCYRISRIEAEANQPGPIRLGGTLTLTLGRGFQEDDGSFTELDRFVYTLTPQEFGAYMLGPTSGAPRGEEMMAAMGTILSEAGQISDGVLL